MDQKRVLIIDDDPQILKLMSFVLGSGQYHVLGASSGFEALAIVSENAPDLIFCDLTMPDMDGIETVRRIRSLPNGSSVPILMLTALSERSNMDDSLAAGATDYLTKPFSAKEILAKTASFFKSDR